MHGNQQPEVTLRDWSEDDLPLLERLMGDPDMTTYLGGPEPMDQIRKRHERYCQISDSGKGRMFMVVGSGRVTAGSVGDWETEWQGQLVWETGWSVLREFLGQGIATNASLAVVKQARRRQVSVHSCFSVS
jgi:RimJ/RimL family protein N-acetyltransferase